MDQAYLLLDKFLFSCTNETKQLINTEHDDVLSAFRHSGEDSLYVAVQENRFQAVKFMIQHNFSSEDDDLGYRAAETGNLELVKLLDNPTSIEKCPYCIHYRLPAKKIDMFGCLTGACSVDEGKGAMDIIDYLLETGRPIDQCALEMICEHGNVDILDRFIRHMTETNDFSPLRPPPCRFGTFLHEACYWAGLKLSRGCSYTVATLQPPTKIVKHHSK